MGAFKDFMNRGGAPAMAKPRGGGGNNRNRNRNNNGNKNKQKSKTKGGGGDPPSIGPELPTLNADLGLNAPNTGGAGGAFSMSSAGFGVGNKPAFSDKSEYEQTFFKDNPQGGFNAFASAAGMSPTGQDAFGQWLGRQYDLEQQNYQMLAGDDQNQNLSWFDYLGNLTGTKYGQPGWEDAYKRYWTGRYNNDSMANRGLNDMPYQGNTRWLAFG